MTQDEQGTPESVDPSEQESPDLTEPAIEAAASEPVEAEVTEPEPTESEPVADDPEAAPTEIVPPPHAVADDPEESTEVVDQVAEVPPPPGAGDAVPLDHDDALVLGVPVPGDTYAEPTPKRRRRWLRYGLPAAALVLGGLYLAGWYFTGERLPAGTTIAGVEVGGQSPAAARETLTRELTPKADQDLTLTYEDQQFVLKPSDIGLALDAKASVAEAGGQRSWDPRDMVRLVFGGRDLAPELTVDEKLLDAAVASISESINVDVTEPLISFPNGQPEARQPADGLRVRSKATHEAIEAAYLVSTDPITVPTEVMEPSVDAAGLQQAMTTIAQPAISAPVALQVGDQRIELPVTAYAPALTIGVKDGEMVPMIDAAALAGPLTDSTTGLGAKAVDASFTIVGGKPQITPSKPGVGLDPEKLAVDLVPVLTATGDARTIAVEATAVQPKFTTEDAEKLGIVEKVGEFTTQFPFAPYRNTNQGRAAALINGTILKPGETFSFNDTVGERTRANGFTDGIVINGGVFREEIGGGVSQVATTTYNAAFFAGLDDVEHHPHAFYIDRYPVGREATVYFGSKDLRFKNSTPYGVLITATVKPSTPGSPGVTTVQMWSTKIYDVTASESARRNQRTPGTRYDDSDRCVPQSPVTGFDIDIIRTIKQNGAVVKRETDTAVYKAADRVICGPAPAAPPAG